MKDIPISEMTIERLRVELASCLEANKLQHSANTALREKLAKKQEEVADAEKETTKKQRLLDDWLKRDEFLAADNDELEKQVEKLGKRAYEESCVVKMHLDALVAQDAKYDKLQSQLSRLQDLLKEKIKAEIHAPIEKYGDPQYKINEFALYDLIGVCQQYREHVSKLQGALEKMSFNASISERLCSTECVFCKKNMNFATEALTDTAQLREKVGKYEAYFKIKVQRGDMSARFAADYSDEVNAWNKEIDGLQSKLARYEGALEDKVVKCCETCDSFLTHAKCKTFSSNLKAHGRCPFDSQEKKNTDTCDKWNIEALTTAPVGKPADDRCCAMPGTVMCCKNIAPVCETCEDRALAITELKSELNRGVFNDLDKIHFENRIKELAKPCPDCKESEDGKV